MNNRWKFGALLAGDIKLITVYLFVGAHQFILSLHGSLVYTSKAFKEHILVYLCVYTSDCSFVAQKFFWEVKVPQSCLIHEKVLKTVKVAKTLPSTIYIGLPLSDLSLCWRGGGGGCSLPVEVGQGGHGNNWEGESKMIETRTRDRHRQIEKWKGV